jgi:hypothetical protein
MTQQVKIDPQVKQEVALCAAITGKTQGALLEESWSEYKQNHHDDFEKGLKWASSVLDTPGAAAVYASGMSTEDIEEIDAALNG